MAASPDVLCVRLAQCAPEPELLSELLDAAQAAIQAAPHSIAVLVDLTKASASPANLAAISAFMRREDVSSERILGTVIVVTVTQSQIARPILALASKPFSRPFCLATTAEEAADFIAELVAANDENDQEI